MNVYILRHGIATEPGDPAYPKDSQRPLTDEGERKTRRIAEAMGKMEICFEAILASPYVRAKQTAEIVAQVFNLRKRLQFTDALTPGAVQEEILDALKRLEKQVDSVLLVGHEPSLSELVSRLVSGASTCSIVLKKGGLCKVAVDAIRNGACGSLEWLVTPRQMLLMK